MAEPRNRLRFGLVVAVLLVCLVGGGSSWETSLSLLYIRPVLVLLCAALLIVPGQPCGVALRWPTLLLVAFAATMAIQLIPLPPVWWQALPGREPYYAAVRLVGEADVWRPISLSPDRTANSLLALLPAIAVLIGLHGFTRRQLEDLVPLLLAMIVASAVLGVVQWSGSGYLYRQASLGFPTGFFANRNHQAVFLALAFPLMRVWLHVAQEREIVRPWHFYAAFAVALFLVAIIVTTGSRAGLAAMVIGLLASAFLVPSTGRREHWSRGTRRYVMLGGVILALLIGAIFFFGRAVSVDRLTDTDNYTAELRVRFTPLLIALVRNFGWAGSGFGTFDEVFRALEPDWALKPTFFNRAHNELLEVAITGGVAALLVIVMFLTWFLRRAFSLWRSKIWSTGTALGRLGSIVVGLSFMASLVDYPLRTPVMGAVLAVAVAWLTMTEQRRGASG